MSVRVTGRAFSGLCGCGAVIYVTLLAPTGVLSPPTINGIHQCASPPREFVLRYAGSAKPSNDPRRSRMP